MNRITRLGWGFKVIPALLVVMISLMGAGTGVQVAYAETAGGVGVDGSSSDKGQVSEVRDGDCKIRTDNCSWEISLYYKGAFRGSFLACSNGTLESASPGGLNDSAAKAKVIINTKYLNSQGIRIARGTSDTKGARYDKTTPRFTDESAIKGWGTNVDILSNFIFNSIWFKNPGLFPKSEKDKMIQMVKDFNKADPATKAAKFASGEWFPYFVTMRPVMLVYRKGVFVSMNPSVDNEGYYDGGIGYTFEFNNREQQWDKYHNSLRGYYNWEYIVQRMNNPQHNEEHHPGDYGQPHEWPIKDITYSGPGPDGKIIGSETGREGNYYIFFFGEKSEGSGEGDIIPPTPTPPPPPAPGKYEELRIHEHELLAAIPTSFNKDGNTSNKFADNARDIRVKEKSTTQDSRRVDRIEHYETCSEYDCHTSECHCGSEHMDSAGSSDDPSTPGDESSPPTYSPCPGAGCSICGSTLWHAFYCYENYTFNWTKDPSARMDETDLKSESNVTATDTDLGNSSMSAAHTVREYEITRKNGVMDIEFTNSGNMLREFQWNNYHTNGEQIVSGIDEADVSSSTGWLVPKDSTKPPEPFKDGFTEVINTHRFSKYNTTGPLPEEKLLPLAGYMNDTAENKAYTTWMNDRGLAVRNRWMLNEKNANTIKGIYDGTYPMGSADKKVGIDISWGHGGNGGTDTSSSDLNWNNEWWWSREHKPSDTPYSNGCPDDESSPATTHSDLASTSSGGLPAEADEIKTPRAVLGRTLVVEPTLRGDPKSKLVDSYHYNISKNPISKSDRLTFKIPSTIFKFSPTYKMYADYTLDSQRSVDSETPVWMLASDVDEVQFEDVLEINISGGETIVRAPWSRDFEDRNARDLNNAKKKINVLKAGQAYAVETKNSKITITAIVHYWDENFWNAANPTAEETAAKNKAIADNAIIQAYEESIKKLAADITDESFGFYTNLVGGTSEGSLLRKYPRLNPEIFSGATYTNTKQIPAVKMTITEPTLAEYSKLRLKPDTSPGYVKMGKKLTGPDTERKWRVNGSVPGWDSSFAQGDIEWTPVVMQEIIKSFSSTSHSQLTGVLLDQPSTSTNVGDWYVEDYEGIKVAVITATIDIPAVRSYPATVYEKLSDFQTPMNQWSPKLTHPNLINEDSGMIGSGQATLIEAGSVGAGTILTLPSFTIYPGGVGNPTPATNWSLCYEPFLFGVRGSVFDN